MTLTKTEIIDDIVSETGLHRVTASDGLEAFIDIIISNLSKGEDITLSGFGKFSVREKRARRCRSPRTAEEIVITPRCSVSFSLSNVLRAQLNDGDKK